MENIDKKMDRQLIFCLQRYKLESEQATTVDSKKDVVQSSM